LFFFFVAKDRSYAAGQALRAGVTILAASFLCALLVLVNYSLLLDGFGA